MNIIDRIFRYLGYKRIANNTKGTHVKETLYSLLISRKLKFVPKDFARKVQYIDVEGCKPEDEAPLSDEEKVLTSPIKYVS